MKTISLVACACFFASGSQGEAVWTPIVAELRESVVMISPDGKETVTRESVGEFLRTSKGIELETKKRTAEGKAQEPGIGTYRDLNTGAAYELRFDRRTAILRQKPFPEGAPRQAAPSGGLGDRVIHGVRCTLFPVRGDGVTGGYACRSLEHDFFVKTVVEYGRGPNRFRRETERFNIALGAEPEEGKVRLPADLEIIDDLSQVGFRETPQKCCADKADKR
ncbi:MAG: hypothetical protein KIT09_26650 [Bryobacteraceae bacterium]|nr:hypothetical protein [Bryobacteraceae bacterium]